MKILKKFNEISHFADGSTYDEEPYNIKNEKENELNNISTNIFSEYEKFSKKYGDDIAFEEMLKTVLTDINFYKKELK